METPIQELIKIIEEMPAFKYEPVVIGIHEKATELLAKEKQQHFNTFDAGYKYCEWNYNNSTSEQPNKETYFSQTYNTNNQ